MSSQKPKYEPVAPKDAPSDDLEETTQIGDDFIEKPETPLKRRFWMRAVSCILCPPLLAAYFLWTYIEFLRPGIERDSHSLTPDGTLIWWSWFVIGALGLNVSTYVLAGVEAGMLMQLRSGVLTIDQISLHKDKSWSKLSGWFDTLKGTFRGRKTEQKSFSWIWFVLFTLSLMSWAFVLTGLTMETRDSFKPGRNRGVAVLGADASTFFLRNSHDVLEAAFQNWGQAQEATVPWNGAVYFTPGCEARFNMTGGNAIPSRTEFHPTGTSKDSNGDAPTTMEPIFLAPQSKFPVTGETWGLLVKYRCNTVTKLSEFKILSHRLNSSAPNYINGDEKNGTGGTLPINYWTGDIPSHIFYRVPDLDHGSQSPTISFLKCLYTFPGDLMMVAEVGMSNGVDALQWNNRSYGSNYTRGIEDEDIFEVALWQFKMGRSRVDTPDYWMEGIIPELTGEHSMTIPSVNKTIRMHAIGVQCISSSAVGTARLDGFAGTFTDFTTDGSLPQHQEEPLHRFGNAVPTMLLPGLRGYVWSPVDLAADKSYKWLFPGDNSSNTLSPYYGVKISLSEEDDATLDLTADWMRPLIASANLPINGSDIDEWNRTFVRYSHPINPAELRHALEEAHKMVAASMMYNQQTSPGTAWFHPNLTAAEPWKQLVSAQGKQSISPLPILIFLTLWAIGCVTLGAMYGFQPRWDSFFSVKSMYWYCVEIADVNPEEAMRS